jgi:hypothetical protein
LYEVRRPLTRAFFVARHAVVAPTDGGSRAIEDPSFDPLQTVLLERDPVGLPASAPFDAAAPSVEYRTLGAHAVAVTTRTPPGFVVVLDGYHPDWTAEDESGRPVPVLKADGRYRAIPTPGGAHVFTLRYRPSWRYPALAALLAGALGVAALLAVSQFTAVRTRARATLPPGGGGDDR